MGGESDQDKETNQEELEKALNAGFDSDDSYQIEDEEKPDEEIKEADPVIENSGGDSLDGSDEDSDGKPDEANEEDANQDEWKGVPEAVVNRFAAMEESLKQAQNIAKSANGRASKAQEELLKYQTKTKEKQRPTSEQIQEAIKDPEGFEKLQEEWPEIATVIKELNKANAEAVGQQFDSVKNDIRQEFIQYNQHSQEELLSRWKLDNAHPGWENTVNEVTFKEWLYEGGPTTQQRSEYESKLHLAQSSTSQEKQAQALQEANTYYNNLLTQYPEWAIEKGNLYGDSSTSSAIKLLDTYKSTQEAGEKKPKPKAKSKRRLADNVAPTEGKGVIQPKDSEIDAQKAFEDGFNSSSY